MNPPTQSVFKRVIARKVASPDLQQGRLIHVMWIAPEQGDRLVQVYLNGTLTATTSSTRQRDAWLLVASSEHNEIELLATNPHAVTEDLSHHLKGADSPTRTTPRIALLRDHRQPIDSMLTLAIEDTNHADQSPLFTPDDARAGFGAVFGEGGFGYDASTGPGLGMGELGYGPLGTDGAALYWRNDALPAGDYRIRLSLDSPSGQTATHEQSQAVTRLPNPPVDLSLNADLQLTWT